MDWYIMHQQCTLNTLWQVICLPAKNNALSNGRILHQMRWLDNGIIENDKKSASANTGHIQIPVLCLKCWGCTSYWKMLCIWRSYTAPIQDRGSVLRDRNNGPNARCPSNAADVMSDFGGVTRGFFSIRAQLVQQHHFATCTLVRGKNKGREEESLGPSPSLLVSTRSISLSRPCVRNEPQPLKDGHLRNLLCL